MQKLKLNIDALHVASFETTPPQAQARGTVQANQDTVYCSAVTACYCHSSGFSFTCQDTNTDTIPDPEGPQISQVTCTHAN
jgi:hypothetical protein